MKRALSLQDVARFHFDYTGAEIDFEVVRPDFDAQIWSSAERILKVMDETLASSQLRPDQIDIVYCTWRHLQTARDPRRTP